jgi:hypothetical protein
MAPNYFFIDLHQPGYELGILAIVTVAISSTSLLLIAVYLFQKGRYKLQRYRLGLVIILFALLVYNPLVIYSHFFADTFTPVKTLWIFATGLKAGVISLDILLLETYRVINPNITDRFLKGLKIGFGILFGLKIIFDILNLVVLQPIFSPYTIYLFLSVALAVVIYDFGTKMYLIFLIYYNTKTHDKHVKFEAMKKVTNLCATLVIFDVAMVVFALISAQFPDGNIKSGVITIGEGFGSLHLAAMAVVYEKMKILTFAGNKSIQKPSKLPKLHKSVQKPSKLPKLPIMKKPTVSTTKN